MCNEVWLTVEWSFPSLIQHYQIWSSRASLEWFSINTGDDNEKLTSCLHHFQVVWVPLVPKHGPGGSDKQTNKITQIVFVGRLLVWVTSLVLTHACIYVHPLGNLTTCHKVLLHLISESVPSPRCLQLRNSDEVELKTPTRERDTCHRV